MPSLRASFLFLLTVLGAPSQAAAQALPAYDRVAFCGWKVETEVASKPATDAARFGRRCTELEESARGELIALWPQLSSETKGWCAGQVESAARQVGAPAGSYNLLYDCVLEQITGFLPPIE